VIQDCETQVLISALSSGTYAWSTIVILKEMLLHGRMNSWNCPYNSAGVTKYHPQLPVFTTPLTYLKTVSMSLPLYTTVLKFFITGDPS
jgi:hypothetical protein